MSLIQCISNCIYQKDGVCLLDNAVSGGVPNDDGCIHYVPKNGVQYSEVNKND